MSFVIQEHMPTESWWTDWPRFYERQKQEQPRMRISRYGQAAQLITGVEGPARPKPRVDLASLGL